MSSIDLFTKTQTIHRKNILLPSGETFDLVKDACDNMLVWKNPDDEHFIVSIELDDTLDNFVICGTFLSDKPIIKQDMIDLCSAVLRPKTHIVILLCTVSDVLKESTIYAASFREVVGSDKSQFN